MLKKYLSQYVLALFIAMCLFALGWQSKVWYQRYFECHKYRIVKASGKRFTTPLLDVELPEGLSVNSDVMQFKYKLVDFVKLQTDGVRIRHISVYFRDLLDGPWFGINERHEFNPASMMKVPVMIAWLKRAENNPDELRRTFVFDGKDDLTAQQSIKPVRTITPGKRYTIMELLTYMLRYSDNNAASLLYFNLSQQELNDVLDNMDVNNVPNDENNSISVVGYSGFFRILYNASYLNRNMSEKALQLLSMEDFPQGFAAGVPKETTISSKFGEFERSVKGESKQLHEFGIIYHPKGHYILGVMTEGSDYVRQAAVIKDISALVYAEVNSHGMKVK